VNNFRLIRHLGIKVIGCTTTGLSKYRGLLAALQPRILLIEEAAEALEGSVMAGMFESLEQLILVGDHQQLQAHANVRALEATPYNLSMSMFERLINNSIGHTMLNKQRRMITDVRKLLCIEPRPFYADLQDHPSVLDRRANRIPVPGMGGKDTYFFHHNWPEQKSSDLSRSNVDEAEMIAGFYYHLIMNGLEYSKITVLTVSRSSQTPDVILTKLVVLQRPA
jgi:helicase required for RNAi-mediated heterochromatin assembly 1